MWDIWKGLKRTAHDLEVVNFMALAGPLALWGEEPQGFNCLPKVSGVTGSGLQGLARSFAFSSGSFKVGLFVSTEQVTTRQLGGQQARGTALQTTNNPRELQNLQVWLWEAAQGLESRRWVGLAAIVL